MLCRASPLKQDQYTTILCASTICAHIANVTGGLFFRPPRLPRLRGLEHLQRGTQYLLSTISPALSAVQVWCLLGGVLQWRRPICKANGATGNGIFSFRYRLTLINPVDRAGILGEPPRTPSFALERGRCLRTVPLELSSFTLGKGCTQPHALRASQTLDA